MPLPARDSRGVLLLPARRFGTLALAAALAWLAAGRVDAQSPRFYFSGDGVIALHHAHFREHLDLRYRDRSGRYDPTALARIRHFFRSREDGSVGEVTLRLIELVDYLQDRYGPQRTVLVSGYRSPALNEQLRSSGARVARSSLHMEGMAADLQLVGVDQRAVWDSLRELGVGGVGLYEKDGFLHVDTGKPRFWEPATSRVEQNLSQGNARLFARTEYDRYESLDGAEITLHSLTALPLRVARGAFVGDRAVQLEPVMDEDGDAAIEGECYVVGDFEVTPRFRIVADEGAVPAAERLPLRLHTCGPRVESTPEEILTNPIESLDGD